MNEGELFELCGSGWRLPIFAKLIDGDKFEVRIADIPLLKQMREAAENSLRTFCERREGDAWFFARRHLEQIAYRGDRQNPEDVVVWRRHEDDKENPPADEFVKGFCESRFAPNHGMFKNPEAMAIIWRAFHSFMLDWMFRGGTVDLGFAKLDAFVARENWKSVIIGRVTARQRNGVSKDTEGTRREIRRLLHQNFITACADGKTVRWTLDIEATKHFHQLAELVEIKRKRQQRGSYAFKVLRLLKSHGHKNRMHQAVEAYWKETQIPCAVLPRGLRLDETEKKESLECQPAPKLIPTPVVEGASMKDKSGFVSLTDAPTLTADDLRRLSDGPGCVETVRGKDEQ